MDFFGTVLTKSIHIELLIVNEGWPLFTLISDVDFALNSSPFFHPVWY